MAFQPHDVVPDSPINNFATLNPLSFPQGNANNFLSNGNLTASSTTGGAYTKRASMFVQSGKYYWELCWSNTTSLMFGLGSQTVHTLDMFGGNGYLGFYVAGNYFKLDGSQQAFSWSFDAGDIIGMLVDKDNNTLTMYKNGQIVNSTIDFSGSSYLSNDGLALAIASGASVDTNVVTINFGQDHTFGGATNLPAGAGSHSTDTAGASTGGSFAFQPPAGALALCTKNIPEGPIKLSQDETPSDHFKTVLYTGKTTINDGTVDPNDGNKINVNVGFQADLVWLKDRNYNGWSPRLWDSIRDAVLLTNGTSAQFTESGQVQSVTNQGFSCSDDATHNTSGRTYVGWCWKAAGSPDPNQAKIINADGTQADTTCAALASAAGASITPSKISANRQNGFSIVKYEGTGGSIGVPHGLNKAAEFVICKKLVAGTSGSDTFWVVGHFPSIGNTKYLKLDTNDTDSTATAAWNDTSPTDTVVTFGSSNVLNDNGHEHIMYCWHSVAGYSKIGSYIGNGSADGPYIECGFRPAWLMWKRTDVGNQWYIIDSARDSYNPAGKALNPNTWGPESGQSNRLDLLSAGFKLRRGGSGWFDQNASGGTYIFMAFAEQPFSGPSNAR